MATSLLQITKQKSYNLILYLRYTCAVPVSHVKRRPGRLQTVQTMQIVQTENFLQCIIFIYYFLIIIFLKF